MQTIQDMLQKILNRMDVIEQKVGVGGPGSTLESDGIPEKSAAVVAYEEYIKTSLEPFCDVLDSFPDLAKTSLSSDLKTAWNTIGDIVLMGSKVKKGPGKSDFEVISKELLKPAQDALSNIRKIRFRSREFDYHLKAITEATACLGWFMIDPTSDPPSPSAFVKNTIGASDYWANKIRKDYKNKGSDDKNAANHIKFCDGLKKLIADLVTYTKTHHMSGLSFNFNGIPLKEYLENKDASPSEAPKETSKTVEQKPKPVATAAAGGGMASLAAELASKRSSTGESAATGLKKVTKDQQTWRKEYKKEPSASTSSTTKSVGTSVVKPAQTTKKAPAPVFEFRDRGGKWVLEHQNKSTTEDSNGLITVKVKDPKHHVYVYKCEGVTFDIQGKLNSLTFDSCTKCNFVFDTAISSCEVVNCKKVQVQTRQNCNSFSVDKTDGFVAYLSKESMKNATFVTSKSSEMNVNYPVDEYGDEMKEVPIPEQFQHSFTEDGVLASQVSDLYH